MKRAITLGLACLAASVIAGQRPNILLMITDDQSWCHTSFAGDPVVTTPSFDRVAREGVYFERAYVSSPSCTPSRGALLAGQHVWRLREGASLWGTMMKDIPLYNELLEEAGYHMGYTGKGWSPGESIPGGRFRNPAGWAWNAVKQELPEGTVQHGLNPIDYFANFERFLQARKEGQPFCFWFGATEPHHPWPDGLGAAYVLNPDDVEVPPFAPDLPGVRKQFTEYYAELVYADLQLSRFLRKLEEIGELDNTIVVCTSDNGMPIPRAKEDLNDWGTRVPLAIRWGGIEHPGRRVDDFVSLIDLAPTFLELAGAEVPEVMTGRSLLPQLESDQEGTVDPTRSFMVTGRERHDSAYPMRAIRTDRYLYIRNYEPTWHPKPAKWNEGPKFPDHELMKKTQYDLLLYNLMLVHRDMPEIRPYYDLAFKPRPAEEFYDLKTDPFCLKNVADDPEYAVRKKRHARQMTDFLIETGDPRETDEQVHFQDYPWYGGQWREDNLDQLKKWWKQAAEYERTHRK